MPTRQERLLEIALEAIAKLKGRVDSLPEPQAGPQGLQGEKGDKGDTGEQGPQGLQGERGEQGPQGEVGPKGDKGDTGERGPQGEQGPQGEAGRNGRDGKDGRDGQDGAAGPAGADGKDGADGRDGIDGRGVAQAEINANGELVFTFTDGEEVNLGRVVGDDGITQTLIKAGKAGVSEQRVLELIAQNGGGGGGGGGESRQEVFIGEQPAINYPAISYSLIEGTNLYRMSVNVV